MFFSLKHKKNQRQHSQNLKTNKVAAMWAIRCIHAQFKVASLLQAKSEKLSLNTKRLIVVAFSVISFSSCVYLVVKSSLGNQNIDLSIAAIEVPEHILQNEDKPLGPSKRVSKSEFEKVKKFRAYLDSLATSNSGRRIYDSIVKYPPGLIDSLVFIENFYKSHSSNK